MLDAAGSCNALAETVNAATPVLLAVLALWQSHVHRQVRTNAAHLARAENLIASVTRRGDVAPDATPRRRATDDPTGG